MNLFKYTHSCRNTTYLRHPGYIQVHAFVHTHNILTTPRAHSSTRICAHRTYLRHPGHIQVHAFVYTHNRQTTPRAHSSTRIRVHTQQTDDTQGTFKYTHSCTHTLDRRHPGHIQVHAFVCTHNRRHPGHIQVHAFVCTHNKRHPGRFLYRGPAPRGPQEETSDRWWAAF